VSAEDRVGYLFGVGLPGPEVDVSTARLVRDLAPSVFVLFARNLRSPSQVRELGSGLRETSAHPVLVAIDQEGGRVSRLKALASDLETPSAARLGATGPDRTNTLGEATGRALAALDLDWDFAPTVDLDEPGNPSGIGDRSFGKDPVRTAEHATAFLEGLHAAGVLGCLKHFPGLGHTAVDTHDALAVCTRTSSDLWDEDVSPYRELCASAEAVMVGHAAYPEITGRDDRPATLSPEIVGEWLRNRVGFTGLAVSDDLEMGALAKGADSDNARDALRAGCDLLLFCADGDRARRARDTLAHDAAAGRLDGSRILAAASRIDALHTRLGALRQNAPPRCSLDEALETLRRAAAI
jgi:beta-N-acetylhexosaminidase